ncbi:L-seryl-tRNA(Sec) kinase-like [Corticium candelabrum]|uniref:L-seryl-tRNA(Sec) kinase-like n=1 Tax=Corticium candelabrum TaxID=121492 RepID=UPI002E26F272|nr:L-seryl-tRNA(Sec) kinase-like [Corticium candelabrum]
MMAAGFGEGACTCSVLLMCGIPASGKTTLAQKIVAKFSPGVGNSVDFHEIPLKLRVLHVCFDDFVSEDLQLDALQRESGDDGRQGGGDQEERKVWKYERRRVLQCIERLLAILVAFDGKLNHTNSGGGDDTGVWENFEKVVCKRSNLSNLSPNCSDITKEKYLVVVDDNFFYRSMRYEIFQMARTFQCGFGQLALTCTVADAIYRNKMRSTQVSDDSINRMGARLEMPDVESHSWEARSFVVVSLNVEHELGSEICRFICNLFLYPVRPLIDEAREECKAASKAANLESVIHQADRILRKCVAGTMRITKGINKQEMKEMSEKANSVRRIILGKVKSGLLPLAPGGTKNISDNISSVFYDELHSLQL